MILKINAVDKSFQTRQISLSNIEEVHAPRQSVLKRSTLSPSTENFQANFLTFTGKEEKQSGSKLEKLFGDGIRNAAAIDKELSIQEPANNSWKKTVTNIPGEGLYDLPYYQELAKETAIALGPDRTVLLSTESGVETPFLVHRFAKDVLTGKYSNLGMLRQNTDVIFIDTKKAAEAKVSIVSELEKMLLRNAEQTRKTVVFLSDIEPLMTELLKNKMSLKEFIEERQLGERVKLVGMMEEKVLQKATDNLQIQNFTVLDFKGMGVNDTKELLKEQSYMVFDKVSSRHSDRYIKFSPEAIDELVERSSTQVFGAFPQKAFNVMDYVISARLQEHGWPQRGEMIISAADVQSFFSTHDGILQHLTPKGGKFVFAENVKTRLSDVGGLSSIKKDIKDDIIAFARDPKAYLSEGKKPPRGVLLTGPPGNGKTLLSRAIAGEAGVPFIATKGSDLTGNMYQNSGKEAVTALFSQARAAAKASGKNVAIVFVDEIDGVGLDREAPHGGGSENTKTITSLFTEMDGFNNKESKIHVVVIGATNRKNILDAALLRRFDTTFDVPNPETDADRREILEIHTRDAKFANAAEKEALLKEVTVMTEGFSGDEIGKTISKALKIVANRKENKVLTINDVVEGFLQVHAGPVRKSEMPMEEQKMIVRHEGGHAVLIDFLKRDKVSFITLDPRGSFLGAVFRNPSKRHYNLPAVIYSAAISYAGGLAEPEFDQVGRSAGVSGDVNNATRLITRAITECGLGVHTPPIKIDDTNRALYAAEIKRDINLFTGAAQALAQKGIGFHNKFLDEYVQIFENSAGKGGNNFSGMEFSKMRQAWLEKAGKLKAEEELLKWKDALIDAVQHDKDGIFVKFARRIKMMF